MDSKLPLATKKIRQTSLAFQREVVDKMSSLATAALGLVAALAWNTAIQKAFERIPWRDDGLGALLIYAMFVTVVAVLVIIWIGRIAGRLKQAENEETKAAATSATGV